MLSKHRVFRDETIPPGAHARRVEIYNNHGHNIEQVIANQPGETIY